MGEGGKMFRDGDKMISSSAVEVSCYKGNWVNIVQVEVEMMATPVGFQQDSNCSSDKSFRI